MLKERARLIATSLWLADLALIAIAFVLAHGLRAGPLVARGLASPTFPLSDYLPLLPLVLAIWGAFLLRGGYFRSHRTSTLAAEAREILQLSGLAFLSFVLCLFVLRLDELLLRGFRISRLWLVVFFVLTTALLLSFRLAVRTLSHWFRRRGYNFRTVVIVGTNRTARRLAASIEQHRSWGLRLLGFVRGGSAADGEDGAGPLLGDLAELPELVEREVVDEVFFAVSRQELGEMEDLLLALEEQGVCARLALDLFPDLSARLEVGELDGVPLLTFHTAPASALLLLCKRSIDLVFASVMVVLTAPLQLGIAAAIFATSGRPIVFRQTRCGLNGRRFTLLKFRTMVRGADDERPELGHLNEMGGPVFKIRHDPRVTPLGRLLRRFSLDELPQLWNVLKGDMSLVGPRPPLPEEVQSYHRWQRRRLSMRPGLTCLWQIAGRNEIDFDRWMELDLEYIDHWSPSLDLKILARTIPAVLSGRGAS